KGPILHHPSLEGKGSQHSPTAHDLNVARTFDLSFKRLNLADTIDNLAFKLLQRASYFALGEPIPRWLLLATVGLAQDDPTIEEQAEDALGRLVGLGLLETEAEGALRLHRLLAMFVRDVAAGSNSKTEPGTDANVEAQTDVESVLLKVAGEINNSGYPAPLLVLQPHLRAVTEAAKGREDEMAAHLCNELGYHLRMAGDYQAALPYFERALAITEKASGPDHPDTAISLNNLADLLQDQGDYQAALPLYKRALAINEKVLGPDHPSTATSLSNLAVSLNNQRDYQAALPLYKRALAINEKVLGPDHLYTAIILNNLALLHKYQRDYQAALPLYKRALAIREKVLGPDHPYTATSLNNLGDLLQAQGDYSNAAQFVGRALSVFEAKLGPTHPRTQTARKNMQAIEEAIAQQQ
ncbi:MAG TPA: tetratricopeptide repeat protein, partial [Chloroflexia bacterium]|nr:tetratricopeptide repeat protein [Chloroflexia bacterium]